MSETTSHFIDVCLEDIIEACVESSEKAAQETLRQLSQQMAILYNLQFRADSRSLKSLYRHFNPSAVTGRLRLAVAQRADYKQQFFEQISEVLRSANYQELSMQELQVALDEQALFDLKVSVNLSDYDKLLVFRRAAQQQSMTLKRWFNRFGEREVEFINYDRVVLVFSENTPGSDVHIKLFQNVPRHDIEILLPEPQVQMRLRDKFMIGVPAVAGGVAVLVTKLGPTLLLIGSIIAFWLGFKKQPVALDQGMLVALGVGLVALAGHLWRQFGKLKNRRLSFLKTLTENLYFKSLDNNSGAIQQLLDTAADEEVKEVLLAYAFLLMAETLLTLDELDRVIESWLEEQFGCHADFEIGDAIRKASALELVYEERGKYGAIAPDDVLGKVNKALRAIVFPNG